jgi:hypothetical protein
VVRRGDQHIDPPLHEVVEQSFEALPALPPLRHQRHELVGFQHPRAAAVSRAREAVDTWTVARTAHTGIFSVDADFSLGGAWNAMTGAGKTC